MDCRRQWRVSSIAHCAAAAAAAAAADWSHCCACQNSRLSSYTPARAALCARRQVFRHLGLCRRVRAARRPERSLPSGLPSGLSSLPSSLLSSAAALQSRAQCRRTMAAPGLVCVRAVSHCSRRTTCHCKCIEEPSSAALGSSRASCSASGRARLDSMGTKGFPGAAGLCAQCGDDSQSRGPMRGTRGRR